MRPNNGGGARKRHAALWAALLAAFVSLTAPAGFSGEKPPRPENPEEYALQPENPALERIRKEIETSIDQAMQTYLAEQPDGKPRANAGAILGAFHELGRFGDPNLRLAVEYYQAAARLGSPEAECALGNIYQHGIDDARGVIKPNPRLARECYERAAAGGSVRAMLELGAIYAEGRNVNPDSKKALEYFMAAAKRADASALDRLAPVMAKAREWEASHPGKKAGFPTSREEIIDPQLVQEFIDVNFELEKLASRIYVEVSKRLAATVKAPVKN